MGSVLLQKPVAGSTCDCHPFWLHGPLCTPKLQWCLFGKRGSSSLVYVPILSCSSLTHNLCWIWRKLLVLATCQTKISPPFESQATMLHPGQQPRLLSSSRSLCSSGFQDLPCPKTLVTVMLTQQFSPLWPPAQGSRGEDPVLSSQEALSSSYTLIYLMSNVQGVPPDGSRGSSQQERVEKKFVALLQCPQKYLIAIWLHN